MLCEVCRNPRGAKAAPVVVRRTAGTAAVVVAVHPEHFKVLGVKRFEIIVPAESPAGVAVFSAWLAARRGDRAWQSSARQELVGALRRMIAARD